jgi:formate-dependent nitrite reductase membrane component NrfD
MQTRQWMTTHEWMVKPMHQREWIERRGLIFLIAEIFTGLGFGLYLVSLFMNNWWGMLVSWIIIMFLKLPFHLMYFGKPLRFWRTMPPFSNAWKTSWLARGILFNIFFGTFVFVQLALRTPWYDIAPVAYWIFAALSCVSALLVGLYGGFMMNYCKSVPFWNSAILPLVFILAGIADGFGLIMAVGLAGSNINMASVEMWTRITLIVNAFIIIIYLISANYTSAISKLSVTELVKGRMAAAFWGGLVVLGILVPLVISISSLFAGTESSSMMLIIAIVCHTIGAFFLKYCLLKVGIHRPILPRISAY